MIEKISWFFETQGIGFVFGMLFVNTLRFIKDIMESRR
jgi:hypothetical protein